MTHPIAPSGEAIADDFLGAEKPVNSGAAIEAAPLIGIPETDVPTTGFSGTGFSETGSSETGSSEPSLSAVGSADSTASPAPASALAPTAAIPIIAAQTQLNAKAIGDPHVRLKLNQTTIAAVNTDLAQEVMVIPQQRLTVMPNMPAAVMGLLNHRSRIFWVLDLPQLFGLTPLDPRSPEYHLAILRVNEKSVGIAVQEVQGVTRFSPEEVRSPLDHDIAAGLVPYLQGCIPQAEEILLVLDAWAIADYDALPEATPNAA